MTYREKLALANAFCCLFGLAGFAALTWGADAPRGLAPIVWGVLVPLAAIMGIAQIRAAREDERESLIRLKANTVAFGVFILCVGTLIGLAGGLDPQAPIPAGAVMCLMFVVCLAQYAATLFYYRRGV